METEKFSSSIRSGAIWDVVVVGGGPAGLLAAAEAGRLGLSVAVYEEDLVIGRPERCAGLYSVPGLEKIGVPLSRSYLQNFIWGGIIHSPGGEVLEISTSSPVAVVAEREAFDRFLAERTLSAGVEIVTGSRVTSCAREDGEGRLKVIEASGGKSLAKSVILAEGSTANLAKRLFKKYQAPHWMPIVQMLVKNHGLDHKKVHVWFKSYLRDFFGYLVPINEELGKMGVAANRDTLAKAYKLLSEEMPQASPIGFSTHNIYRGPPLSIGLDGDIIIVGDAAGQAKATTGGGVVVGGICAKAAAHHVYNLVREGRDGVYRRETRRIYRELKAIYLVSKLISSMSDKALDKLVRTARESGFSRSLGGRGDMDFQVTGLLRGLASMSGLRMIAWLVKGLL